MDINCDLGENEHPARTRALMQWITSANIACGGHAGTTDTIRRCLGLCQRFSVRAGMHPGFPDRKNFGRTALAITPGQLEHLLDEQTGVFLGLAKQEGVIVRHLKLHGALYHVVEADPHLARTLVHFVKSRLPKLRIYAPPGGQILQEANVAGVKAWGEIFTDRGYLPNGQLAPRDHPKATLKIAEIGARLEQLVHGGNLTAVDGSALHLKGKTLCLHGDSASSLSIARLTARYFHR